MIPISVAVGLLLRDGCVLMGERRPDKIYGLHWEFPGGKLEVGETALDALRRELSEELAIHITDAQEWLRETATYSNGLTYDIHYYLVRGWTGTMENCEFNKIQWVSNEALPTLLHLSGNKNILDRLTHEGIPA
ncbi:MAG: NUDIX domain-containing protein [Bacteroidota bacterium]|nr:NUDIX domain-containing protein [Bacteroidota bacterium]MDP4233439.1 NUDIX domain-containing protein [Bacteroidota bacterium]MDP4242305.1 NUDIX domain-containing protein [Bacteroidota bacterium]MDP4287061.1 NUDIX domain-containing protein [Bacteroidota bacterium]